jgi:acetyltransferase
MDGPEATGAAEKGPRGEDREHRLTPLFRPRAIALVGASPRAGSVGLAMVETALASGFGGSIYLVNPRYREIAKTPCHGSLSSLPEVPDLVVAGVGGRRVEAVLDEALACGARAMVVFDACHGEDHAGRPILSRLRDKAREADLPVCGGNAMGFFDIAHRCHASFYPAAQLKPGGITLIAHSGSVFTVLALNDPRYRFNLVVSAGQEIGVSVDEYIDFALEQPETRVVALFIEAARNPAGFAAALAKAQRRDIPVVVCKVGRTEESARHVRSHTGAVAGSSAAYDAVLERYGALRVGSLDALMDTALLLSQGRPMEAGGLGVVTDSGGLRELLIDRAAEHGVPFAKLSDKSLTALRHTLPSTLEPSNPLDAAGSIDADFSRPFRDSLKIMAEDPAVGILGFEFDGRDDYFYDPQLAEIAASLPALSAKPCFLYSSFAQANNRALAEGFADAGLPLINGLDNMLAAVEGAAAYRDLRALAAIDDPAPAPPPPDEIEAWRQRLGQGAGLQEADGLSLLQAFGVPAVPHRQAETRDAAIEAAAALGWPVALKAAAPGLDHKTEADGIRLDIADGDGLVRAYDELTRRLGARVLVQAMAPRGTELAFGYLRDPDFGPLVMVGAGGTLIELLGDLVTALAPFGPRRARSLIDRLQLRPMLDGRRGGAAADIDALALALARFSVLCENLAPAMTEMDVNPVIAGPQGCLAVDALVVGNG